ncbi:hypothetical protein AB1Y20_012554 [Prymnesium parvum]|uniref:Uncharacterized protein n=1 Tax=Prymnesium parvum TaxID=97485 RepID=A0AB34ILM5_PRYPA
MGTFIPVPVLSPYLASTHCACQQHRRSANPAVARPASAAVLARAPPRTASRAAAHLPPPPTCLGARPCAVRSLPGLLPRPPAPPAWRRPTSAALPPVRRSNLLLPQECHAPSAAHALLASLHPSDSLSVPAPPPAPPRYLAPQGPFVPSAPTHASAAASRAPAPPGNEDSSVSPSPQAGEGHGLVIRPAHRAMSNKRKRKNSEDVTTTAKVLRRIIHGEEGLAEELQAEWEKMNDVPPLANLGEWFPERARRTPMK